jgi:hypothetical protein
LRRYRNPGIGAALLAAGTFLAAGPAAAQPAGPVGPAAPALTAETTGGPGASLTPAAAAPSWGLTSLMKTLAGVDAATARFAARETLQMLTAPLLATGTLTYTAPAYIQKTTISPTPEIFTLDHDQVTISGGTAQKPQVFSLAGDPAIAGLVQGIRATLAGDLVTLTQVYTVQLTGTAASWQLTLRPKSPALQHILQWMIIRGSQNRLTTIDTANPNGDHSEMGITESIIDAK